MISPTQLLPRLPSPAPLMSSLAYLSRSLSSYLQSVASPTAPNEQSECSSFTQIQDWQIVTMKAGDDGKLIPLEYTLNHPTAHILSVTDVDAKDMAMLFWIDNQIYGTTPQLELNKSEDCGLDYADCIRRGFSSGRIQIPKGYHTVRIEWNGVGKWHGFYAGIETSLIKLSIYFAETPGPDGSIDWGEEGGRRLAWRKESCSGSR